MPEGGVLRFVPGRVEGLPDVTEVAFYRDRLEFLSAGRWVSFRLADFAAWPHPAFLWRYLARVGFRPRWLPVGEHDGCRPAAERFFRFYTWPPIVVYMPDELTESCGAITLFNRVHEVIREGGFSTWDLG